MSTVNDYLCGIILLFWKGTTQRLPTCDHKTSHLHNFVAIDARDAILGEDNNIMTYYLKDKRIF